MDKRKENGILLVSEDVLECHQRENHVELSARTNSTAHLQCIPKEATVLDKETELYNTVYKEISEIVGLDATLKIYLRFKGQQISFPVRLYNPNMIQQKVVKEFDGTNIQELARKYDYSEKTIRRMIRDSVAEFDELADVE